MSVKIEQIIRPFSQGASAVSTRLLINDLTKRYIEYIENHIEVYAFKVKETYYIYSKVPSKANEKYNDDTIFYDVLLELIPPNSAFTKSESVRDYDVKVFSNSPSFMFTFTYAYNVNKALIKLPKGFYGEKALRLPPKVRNPFLLLAIDESLWFTVMYLDKHKLFYRMNLDALCDTNSYDMNRFLKEVVGQEEKRKESEDRSIRHRNQRKPKQNLSLTETEKEKARREVLEGTIQKDKSKKENVTRNRTMSSDLYADMSSNLRETRLHMTSLKNSSLKKNNLISKLFKRKNEKKKK